MNANLVKWGLFLAMCCIWGSSFILMKEGMRLLSPYQVASIRILSAGLILLPLAIKNFREIPANKIGWIIISGLTGTFVPAYLFCIAETAIDSALAGILNCLTPLFTILIGIILFKQPVQANKILGVIIGLAGLITMFLTGQSSNLHFTYHAALVLAATICYGTNVQLVARHLKNLDSRKVVAVAFSFLVLPSMIILMVSGFFGLSYQAPQYFRATFASVILGIVGTAFATILFYMLLKRAGPVFSSLVTYGIPFVAIFWGWTAGETITYLQLICLAIILSGIFLANR